MPSALLLCAAPLFTWRDRAMFAASVIAAAAVLASIVVIAMFDKWWGGYSYGPRLFQFALPAVAFLALALAWSSMAMGTMGRTSILSVFAILVVWEAFVHLGGAISPLGFSWNVTPISVDRAPWRLWEWSDPQFLAAFSNGGSAPPPRPPTDGWVRMSASCSDAYVGPGISGREPEFRWTNGYRATLRFGAPANNASRFAIELRPLLDLNRRAQRMTVFLNGAPLGTVVLSQPQWITLQFDLPPQELRTGNTITLTLPDAHRPGGGSQDIRRLGVAIRRFVVTAAPHTFNLPYSTACH
jgi:hypothetical protein